MFLSCLGVMFAIYAVYLLWSLPVGVLASRGGFAPKSGFSELGTADVKKNPRDVYERLGAVVCIAVALVTVVEELLFTVPCMLVAKRYDNMYVPVATILIACAVFGYMHGRSRGGLYVQGFGHVFIVGAAVVYMYMGLSFWLVVLAAWIAHATFDLLLIMGVKLMAYMHMMKPEMQKRYAVQDLADAVADLRAHVEHVRFDPTATDAQRKIAKDALAELDAFVARNSS